ncbi:hypothetical protein SNE40_012307 [Patella caerulea]|uniref:Store-operated calcium entry-associated regulatory factor n=1 Tax=Patella caerulea TaxID=87958 RepID=A0AAN8JR83_PATCE
MEIRIIFTLACFVPLALGGYQQDRVLLTDVKTLTLRHGLMTNARRSSPVPQLKCVGGTAGCHAFVPQVVQCYNRGSDGYDVQWECKTDMDNEFRFGQVEVTCEGYDYPDDPFVLKGSCGLEYSLDLTKEGHQKQGRQSNQHSGYHSNQYHDNSNSYYNSHKKSKSGFGDLIFIAGVGLVIYAIYKTCISSNNRHAGSDEYPRDQGYPGSQSPPPPGFRPEYMPGNDNCHDGYSNTHTRTNGMGGLGGSGLGGGGGGFWTGAMTGGLLGYMFGGRNNGGGYRRGYGTGYGNTGSSWFGSGSTGSGWGSGLGSGSSGFSSGSSGTRSASGFGGTKRR